MVFYTTDGTIPSRTNGFSYTFPITINKNTVLKAKGFADDMNDSNIASATYYIKTEEPIFNPGAIVSENSLNVTIACNSNDTTIKYTIDGTTPSQTNGQIYTSQIAINNTTTIKAISYKNGWNDSNIITEKYTISGTMVNPEFSINQGYYTNTQNLQLTCSTNGSIIKYTTNDTVPSRTNGIIYSSAVPITDNLTIKVIAYRENWPNSTDSSIISGEYTITGKVAVPLFSVTGGIFTSPQTTSISCSTPGAIIRYTTNGTVPTRFNGTIYGSSISISNTQNVKVIAYVSEWKADSNSDVISQSYTITGTVATPEVSIGTGTYNDDQVVTITTSTEGAIIKYTLNGIEPNASNGTIYQEPITINTTGTVLKILAYKENWIDSEITTAEYTFTVSSPLFDPNTNGIYTTSKMVKLSCQTNGAIIKYTTDGTAPDINSTTYTGEFPAANLIKVKAFKTGYNSSNERAIGHAIAKALHVVYYRSSDEKLYYSTNDKGDWVNTVIDYNLTVSGTSIEVDSNNKVHICYYNSKNKTLMYSNNITGSWITSQIDNNPYCGYYNSMAIDSNDNVHISYYDGTNDDLKYITNALGTWQISTLNSAYRVGSDTNLTLDSDNGVYISYFDKTNKAVKYITNSSGSWTDYTLHVTGNLMNYSSIAVDSSKKIHVIYNYDGLYYMTNSSGIWVNQKLSSDTTYRNHLKLDSNDKMHILYSNGNSYYYKTNYSGEWVTKSVFRSDNGGYGLCIDLENRAFTLTGHNFSNYYSLVIGTNIDKSYRSTEPYDSYSGASSASITISK